MDLSQTQRWKDRKAIYRPADDARFRPDDYRVVPLDGDAPAKAFVLSHHFSGSYPAARFRFGLLKKCSDQLEGVAVFSVPSQPKALDVIPGPLESKVELGRFVLVDGVLKNGETWFLGEAFKDLRQRGTAGVLSFADPVKRTNRAGTIIFPGHLGIIYRAHNALYLGRATERTLHLLDDGRAVSARALQKIRARERGWKYAAAELERAGAAPLTATEDSRAWLRLWLPRVTRRLRHAGNLRYVWGLRPDVKAALPRGEPYPKWSDLDATRLAA